MRENLENKIHFIRGHRVMLDSDLAALYGVSTKQLNQQVKRNRNRFPNDFAFKLTGKEVENLKSQAVTSSSRLTMRSQFVTASKRNIRFLPHAFTEHGALMAANILNSEKAIRMSVYVIRAFIQLREVFVANQILEKRLSEIEKILMHHDIGLRDLYEKIRPLLEPVPTAPKPRIGFNRETHDRNILRIVRKTAGSKGKNI